MVRFNFFCFYFLRFYRFLFRIILSFIICHRPTIERRTVLFKIKWFRVCFNRKYKYLIIFLFSFRIGKMRLEKLLIFFRFIFTNMNIQYVPPADNILNEVSFFSHRQRERIFHLLLPVSRIKAAAHLLFNLSKLNRFLDFSWPTNRNKQNNNHQKIFRFRFLWIFI